VPQTFRLAHALASGRGSSEPLLSVYQEADADTQEQDGAMSSDVCESSAFDDIEMEEIVSEPPLKAKELPSAEAVESMKVFLRVRPLSAGLPHAFPLSGRC